MLERRSTSGWRGIPSLNKAQVFGTARDHSVVNKSRRYMTRAIINPLSMFLNPEILHESFHISHAQWICNKQDLIVRKYMDGLEPKSPINFIISRWGGNKHCLNFLTIFKFQNCLVGQLPCLFWLVRRPLNTRRCLREAFYPSLKNIPGPIITI